MSILRFFVDQWTWRVELYQVFCFSFWNSTPFDKLVTEILTVKLIMDSSILEIRDRIVLIKSKYIGGTSAFAQKLWISFNRSHFLQLFSKMIQTIVKININPFYLTFTVYQTNPTTARMKLVILGWVRGWLTSLPATHFFLSSDDIGRHRFHLFLSFSTA